MVMTSACACAAFGLLCIAVATDYWLYTQEKVEGGANGTIYNRFWSGLFRRCKLDGKLLFLQFMYVLFSCCFFCVRNNNL